VTALLENDATLDQVHVLIACPTLTAQEIFSAFLPKEFVEETALFTQIATKTNIVSTNLLLIIVLPTIVDTMGTALTALAPIAYA